MPQALTALVMALALVAGLCVVLLAARRFRFVRAQRARMDLERRMLPIAFDVLEGTRRDTEATLSQQEREAVGKVLARYSRKLAGTPRVRIARFCERSGLVAAEIEALRSRRAWRRAAAAYSLGDMSSDAAVPGLLAALSDRDREVRSAAARSLGRLGVAEAVEPLVRMLASHEVPRVVAGQALIEIGESALPALRALTCVEDPGVRAVAVELVGLLGMPSDGKLIVQRLGDEAPEVRAKACIVLGRLGDRDAAAAVLAALEDSVPFVRVTAANALGAIGDWRAAPALVRQARNDSFDPARAAARALARISPDLAIAACPAAIARWAPEAAAGAHNLPDPGPHLHEAADAAALAA